MKGNQIFFPFQFNRFYFMWDEMWHMRIEKSQVRKAKTKAKAICENFSIEWMPPTSMRSCQSFEISTLTYSLYCLFRSCCCRIVGRWVRVRAYKSVDAQWKKDAIDHVSSFLFSQNVRRRAQFANSHFKPSFLLVLSLHSSVRCFSFLCRRQINVNQSQTVTIWPYALFVFLFVAPNVGKKKKSVPFATHYTHPWNSLGVERWVERAAGNVGCQRRRNGRIVKSMLTLTKLRRRNK